MKTIPFLLLTVTAALGDHTLCSLLPGHPAITVDHADPTSHFPVCHVEGGLTTITLKAPARIDWETFEVGAGNQLSIVSANGAAHASFHNVTTAAPAVIHGAVVADGAFTLQQATGGQIIVGQSGSITAPAITLTTQRAADATAYLRTGSGRFDASPGTQPLLQVEGNLHATGGPLRLIGSRLVQVGPHGKLEAPGQKVSILSGPNAIASSNGLAAAELVDGENNIIQHLGIARGMRVEMQAVPDYDANLCPLGFCGDQPGLYLGGEITAGSVRLDTVHPFDPSVQNETVGSLTAVNPSSGTNFEIQTARFQAQDLGDPIDDDPPVTPAPVRLPGLTTAPRPATSQPLTVTYSHLNSAKSAGRSSTPTATSPAIAVRGTAPQPDRKKSARPTLRGSFFGIPVKSR